LIKIEILTERCKSCEFCISVCKKDVLEIGGKANSKGYRYVSVKNPENCIGCLMCANMCPDAAIEIYR
jgi:2-oxoglutarate ferredoxin oxidoreductase subunit delta